jgi:type IV secretory pathway protease TraF
MASGFYAVVPSARIRRGDIVIACPPAAFAAWAIKHYVLGSGRCSGAAPVVKRVIAVAGDRVDIGTAGIRVNDDPIDGSRPDIALDGGSRCGRSAPVPHVSFGTYRITGHQLLLAGDRRRGSWDSRYWGPTDRVLGRAVLLFSL